MTETIVVVGTGVAGATAAQTLRKEGFAGRVVLIGEEAALPYRRPVLSKDLLAGSITAERAQLEPAGYWADHDIDLRTETRVVELDPLRRRLRLWDNEILDYDAVILATGARARHLDHDGGDRVLSLRTAENVAPLRAAIEAHRSLLVVGAGLIGCEVASTARELGAEVTVLESAPSPLARIVPPAVAEMYVGLHAERDVPVHTGVALRSLTGDDDGVHATAEDGRAWTAGAALVAVGSVPDTALARAAGLTVGDGIVVDEAYRTSAAGVYAAGDAIEQPNPVLGGRHRTENWNSARAQGIAAAKSVLGQPLGAAEVPWGWSNQYGHNLQFAGWSRHDDDYVVRGSIEGRDFTALALRGDRLVGAIALGRPKDIRIVRQLVAAGAAVDRGALADESVALGDVAGRRAAATPASL
ncbi:NAD(P)/FAD-dependent oxidoreductase [Rhodococcus sp. ENV425]|uniref:NAD(P)/FAD-dependent oxidoreductase n=1 Tax=Rhodococcus sp. ENV425 TaxID=2042960 RepID=UPI000C9992D2|nr:FAD-dependent oxidoreductase [Rhodococcus sp. ENV425]PND48682.1 FAD-dependent oxidoreductase [Rhodococcus sp. ENV425]